MQGGHLLANETAVENYNQSTCISPSLTWPDLTWKLATQDYISPSLYMYYTAY